MTFVRTDSAIQATHATQGPSTICVHLWIMENMKCCLLRTGDALEYALIAPGKCTRGPIPTGTANIEETIDYLSKVCEPQVVDHMVRFEPFIREWTVSNKRVRLLHKGNDVVWKIFDQNAKIANYVNYKHVLLNNKDDCAFLNKKLFSIHTLHEVDFYPSDSNNLDSTYYPAVAFMDCPEVSVEERVKYFKQCDVTQVKSVAERIDFIYLKYVFSKSCFDKNIFVNDSDWAITIANGGRSSGVLKSIADDGFGHAAIIIEGRIDTEDKRERCTYFADFSTEGVRLLKEKEAKDQIKKYKHIDQSQTFLISRSKIEKIIQQIKKEQEDKKIVFSLHPLLGKPIELRTFATYETMIETLLGCRPQSILSLLMDIDYPEKTTQSIPYRKVYLMYKNRTKSCFESNHWLGILDDQELPISFSAMEKEDGTWAEMHYPRNCLGWANHHLASIGIYNKSYNYFYTSPKDAITFGHYYIQHSWKNGEKIDPHSNTISKMHKWRQENTPSLNLHAKATKEEREKAFECVRNTLKKHPVSVASLLPEHPDAETLLWLASIYETPGISYEVGRLMRILMYQKVRNEHGQTALHLACAKGYLREATIIIQNTNLSDFAAADLEVTDNLKQSVLDVALTQLKDAELQICFLDLLLTKGVGISRSICLRTRKACEYAKSDVAKTRLQLLQNKYNEVQSDRCSVQ